jgi:hypothetical protein
VGFTVEGYIGGWKRGDVIFLKTVEPERNGIEN